MRLTVLGSGAACAGDGGNSSGYLLTIPDGVRERHLLLDCGHGIASTVAGMMEAAAIEHLLISHMHADHFIDLLPLRFAVTKDMNGLPAPCGTLHLPPGGAAVMRQLLETFCFPLNFFETVWTLREYRSGETVDLGGGLTASFAAGVHYIPAWAMRIDGPQSVVYTGDTAPAPDVTALAAGADLLIAEATLEEPECGPVRGHLTAIQAAELAQSLNEGGQLLLTHFWYDQDREAAGEAARAVTDAPVLVAQDGLILDF